MVHKAMLLVVSSSCRKLLYLQRLRHLHLDHLGHPVYRHKISSFTVVTIEVARRFERRTTTIKSI